jgi:NTP pyrophosphatase (non-canonical NTP hydrolase)
VKLQVAAVVRRSRRLRERYHALEVQQLGAPWSAEEDALAFLTDAALVGRLTMAHAGRWPAKATALEHKLAECVWWLAVLAQRMDVDLEAALVTFLSKTERQVGTR